MSRPRLIALLLALVTLLVYLPVAHDGFLVYDDGEYITENPAVQNGLTWTAILWAFTTQHSSYWHPLTWLSHMMDCELFGPNAGAHHVVNALFHAMNTALLFGLLFRLTGALWTGAFVAALFAWHPLHVESVAWISERKDVLSTFFALLTLLAYTRYAQKQSRIEGRESMAKSSVPALDTRPLGAAKRSEDGSTFDYALALFFFALGLMSKPMLVTLPFVMLLLDYWPLQRVSSDQWQVSKVLRLTLEKWPFFLLAAASCVVTFIAQRKNEAVLTLQQYPLNLRIANALFSYEQYLAKMIWPVNLAVTYPLSLELRRFATITAAAVLIFISITVWLARKRSPCLPVGWLWFLGTLVPVIGLVQVGGVAMADRFTYFPLVGIFIAVAFAVRDLAGRFRWPKMAIAGAAILILAACLLLTENQLRYWRNNESLFRHALAVTQDNDIAHINLVFALELQGRFDEALVEYREALRLQPRTYQIHNSYGNLLGKMGRTDEALAEYREAIRLNPKIPFLHNNLGAELAKLGRFDEAMNTFTNAAQLDPVSPWPHFQMARALLQQGRDAEAIAKLHEALRLDPDNISILAYTAHVLAANENPEIRDGKTAYALATRANALSGGTQPQALDALGMANAELGRFDEAQAVTQKAFDLATLAKMKNFEQLQQRLQLYQNRRPWRESFRATNPAQETFPKIGPR
ncbi:MAG: tetratricopeptide repeat protein [Verrucomicrobiota bacterium]